MILIFFIYFVLYTKVIVCIMFTEIYTLEITAVMASLAIVKHKKITNIEIHVNRGVQRNLKGGGRILRKI